jgi:integrase/recombinase XerC
MEIKGFLNYLQYEKRYAENTLISYSNDLDQFNSFLRDAYGDLSIEEIRHLHVRSWMVSMLEDGVSPRSINRKLSALKSFFKYLKRKGQLKQDPMAKVQSPKTGKRLPEFVEAGQMRELMELLPDADTFAHARDRLVVLLLYGTGMRRAELLGLKVKDVDLKKHQLKVLGKGNKERIIPFSENLSKEIASYLDQRNSLNYIEGDSLILTDGGKSAYAKLVYNIVRSLLSKVSTLKKKSPHILRHSYATHLSNEGAELNAIKELLGHANLSATQVYMHNTIEKLKDIHKQSHPKA